MLGFSAMNGNDPVTTLFSVDAHTVSAAVQQARTFAVDRHLPTDTSAKLAIIVEELVINLIDHGDAHGDISLSLAVTDAGIALVLTDGGTSFDPRSVASPATIPDRGGGAGLTLVRAWALIVDYTREGKANRLELLLPIR